jgi:hypothetical protein
MASNDHDNAPLLEENDSSDDSGPLLQSSELRGSGGIFTWTLTFSAGISGLLFGYEYE